MKLFTDSTGQEWTLEITYGAVMRVRGLSAGRYDLLRPEKPVRIDGLGDVVLQAAIGFDFPTLYEVLVAILRPQLSEREIDALDFAERLGAEALIAAREALIAEWRDFFLRLQRVDQATVLEKMQSWIALGEKKMRQRLANLDLTELDRKVASQMDSIPTSICGPSEPSVESIHAASLGGSSIGCTPGS